MSASHHQKIVVVDDALGFVGGLDLTHGRWDTPEHRCDNTLRCNPDGKPYRPYHDVQVMVDGAAARALGELCRERWQRVEKRPARRVDMAPASDPWPPGIAPEITDIDVGISRTDPGYTTGEPVNEIRHLYADSIGSARQSIYLENQYFSSSVVGTALATRLAGDDAPEVVVVSRRTEEGWLEERTMGVLRARLHKRLRAADAHDRYRLYYPDVPGLQGRHLLNVHSKVLVVDDELCSVGSANFSNRSMGLDTECNLVIEARGDERVRRLIASLRNRLLAEHLGTDPGTVGAEIARAQGSLITAIETLRRPGRTLEPINPEVSSEIDAMVPASAMIDPERPVDPDELMHDFVPAPARRPMLTRVWLTSAAMIALAVLAAVWRWTPLGDWVNLGALVDIGRTLGESPVAPLAVLAAYVVSGVFVVPVTAMIVATGIVFGPLVGGAYALAGTLASAAVTFWIGRRLGRHSVRRLAGKRLNRITRRLAKRGTLAIAVLRLLPVAPFSVVNAVAGASRIGWREFLLGTFLGMLPGIAATVIFVDRVAQAYIDPGLGTFLMLIGFIALIVAAALFVHSRFVRAPATARNAPR